MGSGAYIDEITVRCHLKQDSTSGNLDFYRSDRDTEDLALIGSVSVESGETATVTLTATEVEEWDRIRVYNHEDGYSVALTSIEFARTLAEFDSLDDLALARYTFTVRLGGVDHGSAQPEQDPGVAALRARTAVVQAITVTCHDKWEWLGNDQLEFYLRDRDRELHLLGTVAISTGETKDVPVTQLTAHYFDHIEVFERDLDASGFVAVGVLDFDGRQEFTSVERLAESCRYTFVVELSEWTWPQGHRPPGGF